VSNEPNQEKKPPFKLKPWTLALVSVFLLGAVFSLRLLGDADLGFHLRGGKGIIEDHQVPRVDTYTYTRAGQPYLDLHWGYQALLYLTYKLGNYGAISLLNFLLLMAVLVLTYRRMKVAGAPLFMTVPLLVLFLIASEIRFQVRPEVVSFLLMGLTLWVLEVWSKEGKGSLWFLVPIHLIWVNTEGLFPIGWFLMGAYLISSLVRGKGLDRKLFAYTLAAVAVCLINPYFFQGFLHPFQLLSTLGTSNIFKSTIVEFQPPWRLLGMGPFGPKWAILAYAFYAGLVLALLGATFQKRKFHEFLIAAAFLYLSARANRNIPLFFLATLPLAVQCWKDLSWGWVRNFHEKFLSTPWAAWLLVILTLGVGSRAATNAYYIDQGRTIRTGVGLDREGQPVEAAEFLVKNKLEGRVLNEMNLGGWLGWTLPQPIFVDGRLEVMGEEFYTKQMAAKMREGGLASLLSEYRPDILVMMGIDTPQWILDLKGMSDWRLAFVSQSGVVYLRKGYAPQVPALEGESFLKEKGVDRPSQPDVLVSLKAPGPGSLGHVLEGFLLPQDYPRGAMRMAMFFHTLGDTKTAEPLYLDCLAQGEGKYYDEYLNLGQLYVQEGRHEEARICLEQVLKARRGDPQATALLSSLPR